eukprot:Skav213827  [mRNA]  locus=scaffold1987:710289:712567:+ [translate_table: standard]
MSPCCGAFAQRRRSRPSLPGTKRTAMHGLEKADKLREEGNEFFKSGDFDSARQRYYGAIWHLDFDIGQQWNLMDNHQLDLNTRKLKVISNICGAYLKSEDPPGRLWESEFGISVVQDWVNTKKAADIGLRHMEKGELTDDDAKGKFHYRKGAPPNGRSCKTSLVPWMCRR